MAQAPPPPPEPISNGLLVTLTIVFGVLFVAGCGTTLFALFGVGLLTEGGNLGASQVVLVILGVLLALYPLVLLVCTIAMWVAAKRDRPRGARIAMLVPVPFTVLALAAVIWISLG
jgi:uncharacterized membrane protein YhaH (DUF805 family)